MNLPPFDIFLEGEKPQSLVSAFQSWHFALQADDPNNPSDHKPELTHLLDLLMPDEGPFLDVEADGGYFRVYLSIRFNFHGSIHAFEPVAGTFALMWKNIRAFAPGKNIVYHQVAASDKVVEVTIDVNANSGLSSVKEKVEHVETIKTITLDSLKLDKVDFMDVDVEGHEANAQRSRRHQSVPNPLHLHGKHPGRRKDLRNVRTASVSPRLRLSPLSARLASAQWKPSCWHRTGFRKETSLAHSVHS